MSKSVDHYFYECPRCGAFLGTKQVPLEGPPVCQNYKEHHSKKMFPMKYNADRSTKPEPKPYPKSKKKVYYT